MLKLFMEYASYKGYAAFNNVDFYVGDITGSYNNGGYRFETTFCQGGERRSGGRRDKAGKYISRSQHPMVVFSEPMAVGSSGNPLCEQQC